MLSTSEIRDKYIKFFESKGHKYLPSASLVPHNEPSVLFTIAGMLPFKKIMFGLEAPTYKRATTHQKCFRTNDIENVGRTPRHHTFFEMLGNFSFGDYYKREVIHFAWEFLTKEINLPVEKLYISVYEDDQEAYDIWHKEIGVSEDRLVKLDDESNFWAAGETGPCGPCSEIYFDMGMEYGDGTLDEKPGSETDRFLEIWNLVFMEFNRQEDGSLVPLPAKNIDTGMGLERVASVIQKTKTDFETDNFARIIKEVEKLTDKKYGNNREDDIKFRIVADHVKASVHLISDGVMPGNAGREYVLRRVMRRAVRYGLLLDIQGLFLHKIVPTIIEIDKIAYPNLLEKSEKIIKTIKIEEELFNKTLNNGIKILNKAIETIKSKKLDVISGEIAFELYDTYGFPLELTIEIAEEQNLKVDTEKYKEEMQKQVSRAREARQVLSLNDVAMQMSLDNLSSTVFTGYDELETESKVIATNFDEEKGVFAFVLEKTSAYAESGGQVSDKGKVIFNGREFELKNIQKVGDFFIHVIETREAFAKDDIVKIVVDAEKRSSTARHHSATHLLQKALKEVLGESVHQAGSYVNEEFTRFDFSHPSALTKEEINEVEKIVNRKIMENLAVAKDVMSIDEAKKSGAIAMFGEKYGEIVRVISMGDFSKEFCGGTHVNRTGDIGLFKILSEEAISAGTRRIMAIAGMKSYDYLKAEDNIIQTLVSKFKVPQEDVLTRIEKLQATLIEFEKETNSLKQEIALTKVKELINDTKEVKGIKFISQKIDIQEAKMLKSACDDLLARLTSGVVVLSSIVDGKVNFCSVVSDDLIKRGVSAGEIIKRIAPVVGGRGGGRPNFAQAGGGSETDKLDNALSEVENIISDTLKA